MRRCEDVCTGHVRHECLAACMDACADAYMLVVCVNVRTHECMPQCSCLCTIYTLASAYLYLHICISAYRYLHIGIYISAYLHICISVPAYLHLYWAAWLAMSARPSMRMSTAIQQYGMSARRALACIACKHTYYANTYAGAYAHRRAACTVYRARVTCAQEGSCGRRGKRYARTPYATVCMHLCARALTYACIRLRHAGAHRLCLLAYMRARTRKLRCPVCG